MIANEIDLILDSEFDQGTLSRGLDYFLGFHVVDCKLTESSTGWQIHGHVEGRGVRAYQVEIHFQRKVKGFTLVTQCSCPVHSRCKHAVALLLDMGDRTDPDASDIDSYLLDEEEDVEDFNTLEQSGGHRVERVAGRQWLMDLQNADRQSEQSSADFLLYVLCLSESGPFLSIYKTRRKRDGSLGRLTPYRMTSISHLARPAYMQASDVELLNAAAGFGLGGHVPLQHDHGYRILKLAIATGRCVLHRAEGRTLTWGEGIRADIEWMPQEDGRLRPELCSIPQSLTLLLSPPVIITEKGEVSTVLTGLPPAVACTLLSAPPLSLEALSELMHSLGPLLTKWKIKPPSEVQQIPVIEGIKPVPCLELFRIHLPTKRRQSWTNVAELSFRYGDVHVPAWPAQEYIRHSAPDGQTMIMRDSSAEHFHAQVVRMHTMQHLMGWNCPEAYQHLLGFSSDREWQIFVGERIPQLSVSGWQISLSEDFPWQLRDVEDDAWRGDISDAPDKKGWWSLSLGIEVDGKEVNIIPILLRLFESRGSTQLLQLSEGDQEFLTIPYQEQLLRVPVKRLQPIIHTLLTTFNKEYDFNPLDGKGRLRVSRLEAARIAASTPAAWRSKEDLCSLGKKLEVFSGLEAVLPPAEFAASLRPYQQNGVNWLQFLGEYQFGGILADDMGLGKTVQTIAHLMIEWSKGRLEHPALIVCPKSLIPNWKHELERFAAPLRIVCLQGLKREAQHAAISQCQVVITSYPILGRDIEKLGQRQFSLLVCDEAQYLKNPKTQMARAIRCLNTQNRLALTGTPMENHLGELWSIFDWLQPGYLGGEDAFKRYFRRPIEQQGDPLTARQLAHRIKPFLLRRTKEEVATELPPKVEIIRPVSLEGQQRDIYEAVRATMHDKIQEVVAKKGLAKSNIEILEALLRLRQVCCDPRLLDATAHSKAGSAKMELLMDLLPELIAEGRRILLFSQFTSMLELIEEALNKQQISYLKLTGQTNDRATPVADFQAGKAPVFLISLKAGGVGLNLTAADTVIHYDPWWNPAVENQATDRAHRIGQNKTVFVYKLISENTVEERIVHLQQKKASLANGIYGDEQALSAGLTAEDLKMLLEPLGT